MIVVPIAKDIITTKDGAKYKVVEYTNYKDAGPAVYALSPTKELVLVYFFDIDTINGTKVEYQKASHVFRALGKITRSQPLPQPDDTIVVLDNTISDSEGKSETEVVGFKLKSKALGVNKGLLIKAKDGNYYRLKQILDVDTSIGSDPFNRAAFLAVYKDYTGV